MKIQFTFKHMERSEALQSLAEEKLLSRVSKFTSRPQKIHTTFSVEGLEHKMHVSVLTGDGFDIEAEHSGLDLYSELDIVCEKVEAQLRKHKERLKRHSNASIRKELNQLVDQNSNLNDVESDAIDAGDILKLESRASVDGSSVCGLAGATP